MLSKKRAARLAAYAERAWLPGTENRWRARRAARLLTSAGDRGDAAAIEAVWQGWLRRPGDARWELLSRWRPSPELADQVFLAAADPARDTAERAAVWPSTTSPGGSSARTTHRGVPGPRSRPSSPARAATDWRWGEVAAWS
jgi:hypothetical protein